MRQSQSDKIRTLVSRDDELDRQEVHRHGGGGGGGGRGHAAATRIVLSRVLTQSDYLVESIERNLSSFPPPPFAPSLSYKLPPADFRICLRAADDDDPR